MGDFPSPPDAPRPSRRRDVGTSDARGRLVERRDARRARVHNHRRPTLRGEPPTTRSFPAILFAHRAGIPILPRPSTRARALSPAISPRPLASPSVDARHQAGRHADARDALLQALGDLTREPEPQTETAETEGGSRRSAHSPTDARASVVAALRRVVDATPLAELCDAVSSAVSWAESPRSRAAHSPRARDPSSYLFDTCPTKCLRANSRGGFATSSSNASASGETRRRTRSPRRRRRRNERERKRTRTTRTPRVVSASPRVGFWQLARARVFRSGGRRAGARGCAIRSRARARAPRRDRNRRRRRFAFGIQDPNRRHRRVVARVSRRHARGGGDGGVRASLRLRLRLRLRSRFRNRRRA